MSTAEKFCEGSDLVGRKLINPGVAYDFRSPVSKPFSKINWINDIVEKRRVTKTIAEADTVVIFLKDGRYDSFTKALLHACDRLETPFITIDVMKDKPEDLHDFLKSMDAQIIYVVGVEYACAKSMPCTVHNFMETSFDTIHWNCPVEAY